MKYAIKNLGLIKGIESVMLEIDTEGIIEPFEFKMIGGADKLYPHFVVVSGRAPIWLYGMMLHELHPCKAVAFNDPRLGFIVVQSHCKEFTVGEIIKPA